MLGLKLATDPRWVNIVEKNIEEILVDHAYCEQKAASNAISLIIMYPEKEDLVTAMTAIAIEEMEHFQMVHEQIKKRGFKMGYERKDEYVRDLRSFILKGGSKAQQFVDRLLFAAMIEARSCERFRLLSEEIADEELRQFYHELMVSEAKHYTAFLGFARQYANGADVEKRWQEFLDFEADLMHKYGKKETIHG